MTRSERRLHAWWLTEKYRVSFSVAWRAIAAGVHERCAELADAARTDPCEAFTAAMYALAPKRARART